MYGKKPFDKRYLVIIIVFIVSLLLVVISVSLNKNRNLTFPEKLVKDSVLFVSNIFSAPVNFVKEQVLAVKEKNEIYEKYKEIYNKEESLDELEAEIDNLQEEVDDLKKQLNLNHTLSENTYLNATVINRNVGYWYGEVTIDKGSKNGITKDLAVINSDGLVGVINKVSKNHSTVKLISDTSSLDKISVKIKTSDKYVYGLISGYNSKDNTFTLEGISENTEIKQGAKVVTTGMSNIFPSGILVGTVTGFTKDNFDLTKMVKVKSSVNFGKINYVTILKRSDSK
jgi:rod shape-determining protein MreC